MLRDEGTKPRGNRCGRRRAPAPHLSPIQACPFEVAIVKSDWGDSSSPKSIRPRTLPINTVCPSWWNPLGGIRQSEGIPSERSTLSLLQTKRPRLVHEHRRHATGGNEILAGHLIGLWPES